MDQILYQARTKLKKLLQNNLSSKSIKKINNTYNSCRIICIYIIFFPFIAYLLLAKKKLLNINIKRIGHLCIDVDSFIKESILVNRDLSNFILPSPKKYLANKHIIYYHAKYLKVITFPLISNALYFLAHNKINTYDCSKYTETLNSALSFKIQANWNRPPLYKLSVDDEQHGIKFLNNLGLDVKRWFVCVHSRDSGYSNLINRRVIKDDFGQSFRNTNIESFSTAIDTITSRGGYCVRVGDKSMSKFYHNDKFIDLTDNEDEILNIFFASKCKFFLGNSSGAYAISLIFGRPIIATNMIPPSISYVYGKEDISIPKLFYNRKTKKYAHFRDIFNSNISNARFDYIFKKSNYTFEENSPEDINNIILEKLDENYFEKKDKKEIDKLQKIYKSYMKKSFHSYYSNSKISSYFLLKYKSLIE